MIESKSLVGPPRIEPSPADYYSMLDISLVTDNRKFWKTVKSDVPDKD